MTTVQYADLTLDQAVKLADDPEAKRLLGRLHDRITEVRSEQDRFITWCDRADKLYYAEDFTQWGADLWPDDPSAKTAGRSHVSVNTPAPYVDIPAGLQAVEPVENMLATDTTPKARSAAAALERIYVAWKTSEDYDLKNHKAIVVKALYGRTASRVYWDKDAPGGKRPCFEVVEQPRNLYLGWKSDAYDKLEWTAYLQRMTPDAIVEEFGVEVEARTLDADGTIIPYVQMSAEAAQPSRAWLAFGNARIEVWDYWYRQALRRNGKFVKMVTYNVVFAGNAIVRGPIAYPEYDGDLPYRVLFNTFLPGVPNGRAELHDMEHLIREKMERITAASQMIAGAVAGDYWQLVGPEAPARVPSGLQPRRNQVVAPGAGNRIETITPFVAQFQLEQYLGRIDREMAVVSGLNDLLLGLAPAQVLSSSKAINALIANYEARLSMRRRLLYAWRKANWELALKVWVKKDSTVKRVVDLGGGVLDVQDPSLSPRDEMETATRAINLMNAKLMSQRSGMDLIGIDDPETEQEMIREERTDATMFPAEVQVMAQLLAALQSLGLQAPANAQGEAQAQLASGQNDLRTALGAATPQNSNSSQLAGDQGITPPEALVPGASAPAQPFAQGPAPAQSGVGAQAGAGLAQTLIQGGQAKSRILTQQQLGRR
ncbi:MAG TPA: hypothetical protein VFI40_04720 [Nocardioides sp.]|nr:hypothetical protein [Nocardioides sp.]